MTAASKEQKPERIQIEAAVLITGLKRRNLQSLSASGKVPGAAKLGGLWTYDEVELRNWIKREVSRQCQTISISERRAGRGMPALRFEDAIYERAFEQAIGHSRKSGSPRSQKT